MPQSPPLLPGGVLMLMYRALLKARNGKGYPLSETVHHTLKDEKGEPSFTFHEVGLFQVGDRFWAVAVGVNDAPKPLLTHELVAIGLPSGDAELGIRTFTRFLTTHSSKLPVYLVRLRGGKIASTCKRLEATLKGRVADPQKIDVNILVSSFTSLVLYALPRSPLQIGS